MKTVQVLLYIFYEIVNFRNCVKSTHSGSIVPRKIRRPENGSVTCQFYTLLRVLDWLNDCQLPPQNYLKKRLLMCDSCDWIIYQTHVLAFCWWFIVFRKTTRQEYNLRFHEF